MIGVLQAIEALISNAYQLVGLIAVLGKSGNAVIHGHGEGELQWTQCFGKDSFNAAAEGQGLSGIGLRKQESEFITTNAESGVRGTQGFLERGGGGAEHLVTARMSVLVVHFLEAVQIQDDDAQWETVAARAIELLLERFRKQTAIVEAGEGIGDGIDLEFLVLVIFEHHGNANQSGGREHIHQNSFQRYRAPELVREFTASREHFLPELQALRFAKIQKRGGTEIALQKLAARGNVHDIERVGEKLEVGVFPGQTRGRRGSGTGHGRVFLQSASPRGG